MTDSERQLIEQIVREVVDQLARQGGGASSSADGGASGGGSSSGAPAEIHPPAGVCTGDYSKFPELAGRHISSAAPPSTGGTAGVGASHAAAMPLSNHPVPLSGIVTATQLQAAMNAAPDGVALLAPDARLSPLANDLARQDPKHVRRLEPGSNWAGGAGGAANGGGEVGSSQWLWWSDGNCPTVRELANKRAKSMVPFGAGHTSASLASLVRDVAGAIKARRAAGALLFVSSAARAMCFANRCTTLRAIVGTCPEAVDQGITELGANVLVVEYPHQRPEATVAMVQRMIQQMPCVAPVIERDLADLHRC